MALSRFIQQRSILAFPLAWGAVELIVSPVSAQESPRVGMTWVASDPSCIQAAALSSAVERTLDRPIFHGDSEPVGSISGSIGSVGPRGYLAHVELRSRDGKLASERTVRTPGECHRLDGVVTLAISVMLDDLLGTHAALHVPAPLRTDFPSTSLTAPSPSLLLRYPDPPRFSFPAPLVISHDEPLAVGPEASDPVRLASPEPLAERPARVAASAPAENTAVVDSAHAPTFRTDATALALGAGAALTSGILPRATVGATVRAEIDLKGGLPLAASIRTYGPETVGGAGDPSFRFEGASVELSACPTLSWPSVRASVCGGVGAGLLGGASVRSATAGAPIGPLLFASAVPSVALRAVGPIWVRVDGGVLIAVERPRWISSDANGVQTTAVRPSVASPFAGLGVEFRGGSW